MKLLAAICVLSLACGTAVAQEVRYVTDILQLGLHQAEDTSDSPFRNLVSGTELAVLERVPNYARVRTPDGDEGWVKSAFLVAEQPAQARLAEAEARVAQLESELLQVTTERDLTASDASALVASAELELAAIEASRDRLASLEQERAGFQEQIELYRGSLPWPWVAGAVVIALLGGFVAGWSWLDALIRRRHGGFRVY